MAEFHDAANQGARLPGEMVKVYREKNIDPIDRSEDGVIGYIIIIDIRL